jgi:hypothetical protein
MLGECAEQVIDLAILSNAIQDRRGFSARCIHYFCHGLDSYVYYYFTFGCIDSLVQKNNCQCASPAFLAFVSGGTSAAVFSAFGVPKKVFAGGLTIFFLS